MNCALWLNKQKVQHASEIPENLDVASLRGYFLAGSLVDWLRNNGGVQYAERLSKISPDDPDLNAKIEHIFGGRKAKPAKSKRLRTASETISAPFVQANGSYSLDISSYNVTSFGFVSYGSGSAYLQLSSWSEFLQKFGTSSFGSFNLGSYSQWEFFNLFSIGSFYTGSFTSFHEWEWEWLFRLFSGGSFRLGSFTSFREWEWEWLFSLFSSGGSFSMSSFGFGSFFLRFWNGFFGSFGSLNAPALPDFPVLDEYDRIMLETLMRCPLDRFGYGVHNI